MCLDAEETQGQNQQCGPHPDHLLGVEIGSGQCARLGLAGELPLSLRILTASRQEKVCLEHQHGKTPGWGGGGPQDCALCASAYQAPRPSFKVIVTHKEVQKLQTHMQPGRGLLARLSGAEQVIILSRHAGCTAGFGVGPALRPGATCTQLKHKKNLGTNFLQRGVPCSPLRGFWGAKAEDAITDLKNRHATGSLPCTLPFHALSWLL